MKATALPVISTLAAAGTSWSDEPGAVVVLVTGGRSPAARWARSCVVSDAKGGLHVERRPGGVQGRPWPVVVAQCGSPCWAGTTAYNRGQVLYRVAEVMVAASGSRLRAPTPKG